MANLQERLDDLTKRIVALEDGEKEQKKYLAQKLEDAEGIVSEIRQTITSIVADEEVQKQFIAQKIEDAEGIVQEVRERLQKLEAIVLPTE